jgi:hypothetical protein
MDWIRRNRNLLSVTLAVSAVLAMAELLWARSAPSLVVRPWQLGVLMLPWFSTAASLLSLSYLLWFGRAGSGLLVWIGKVVFWAMSGVFGAMFVVIYGSHVFGIF